MKKKSLEITTSLASVVILIILIVATKLIAPASAHYGYAIALLIFIIVMGISGLKLAETPDK